MMYHEDVYVIGTYHGLQDQDLDQKHLHKTKINIQNKITL